MELDQWKDVWKKQEAPPTPSLKEMLGKRSHSPIAKMKRALFMELLTVILSFGAVVIYYLTAYKGKFQEVGWLYLLLMVMFIVYYYFKNRLLTSMECMSCEVKSNLLKQVSTLEKYTRFYLIAGTALIPLVILFFYAFSWYHFPNGKFMFPLPSEKTSLFESFGTVALVCVLSTFGMYHLNKWYIRKLYGNQIKRLRTMLEDLDQ